MSELLSAPAAALTSLDATWIELLFLGVVGLVVGVAVSLFQALTSVQEQTLSLVPKMVAVILMTLLFLAPALQVMRDYAEGVFSQLVEFGLS